MIKEKNEEFIIYDFDNFKWYLESGTKYCRNK